MKLSSKDRLMLNQGNYIYPEEGYMGLTRKEFDILVDLYGHIQNPVEFMLCSQKTADEMEQVLKDKVTNEMV